MADNNAPPPPPPPPEMDPNAAMPPGGDPNAMGGGPNNGNGGGLDSGAPAVAAAPGKVLIVLGAMVAFVIFMLYSIFSGGEEEVPEEKPSVQVARPSLDEEEFLPEPPPIVETPMIEEPLVIDVPPEPPESKGFPVFGENDAPENELLMERRRSEVLIFADSGGGFLDDEDEEYAAPPTNDPNQEFSNELYKSNTKAQKVEAGRIGDLRSVVAQGKLIHAVLETAINTDLPGPVRAIVSRDIFGEAGRTPLIPKGSRLIGQYNSEIIGSQERVHIVWTRVIRPDGVDAILNSPMVNQIGQAGATGQVDSKFGELFSRALLTSSISIVLAIGADELIDGENISSTNSVTGTTESGSAASLATVDALNSVGRVTEQFLERYINAQPTITVDQGTKVNVFVNRDIIFPPEYTGTRVIQ